jgi:chloramphenicol-sensitive protein RarD
MEHDRVRQTVASADPRSVAALLGAFTIWGLLPLYLRALRAVPPFQIMAYRAVCCCVVVLVWLHLRGGLGAVRNALVNPTTRVRLVASAVLISVNWLTYVWAVASGRVVEASLGYFINPLVNVLLGVLLLRERLRSMQWLAVSSAALGVAYVGWTSGAPPYVALVLAFSFSTYGLLRKTVAVDALTGLGAETLLIAPFCAPYLIACEATGRGALSQPHSNAVALLLFVSGIVTAVPLWLFAYGARRVPYTTVGLLQYVGPTLQLLLGVWVFHEAFSADRAVGFGLIWSGLVTYSVDALLGQRHSGSRAG